MVWFTILLVLVALAVLDWARKRFTGLTHFPLARGTLPLIGNAVMFGDISKVHEVRQ